MVVKYYLLAVMLLSSSLNSFAAELNIFGTIGIQAEAVSPHTSNNKDYVGFRDIYTRIALDFEHQISNDLTFNAVIEMPLDTANFRVQHVWDQKKDVTDTTQRIAKLRFASKKYGAFWIGKGWVPYYNEISAVVDRFSSYYVGYATYSTLREDELLVYTSPNISGWKVNIARARGNGDRERNGTFDDRDQATVSYKTESTKLAVGIEDIGGLNNRRVMGVSIAHTFGNFYMGAKYERNESDLENKSVLGYDESSARNVYLEYTMGRQKFKGHIAHIDGFGEDIFHLGYSYQLNEQTVLFAEYYREQKGAAISSDNGGFRDTYWNEGGKAFALGFNYSFATNLF
ncbi:MAG: porin [Paraglaciecola sp.]|nr:porin [Paraglaciecola sp.]